MENSLLKYIWRNSARDQVFVVCLTVISFPLLYLSLELPKWIINDALATKYQTQTFLGIALDAIPYLVALCVTLLTLIVINGVLKMRVNTYKGIIGERMVRRLRYTLVNRMLRFPVRHFSRVSQGELIATITAETEPLSGYIGESVAQPLFQGGTMLTILIFMFMQNWVLGMAAIALIPLQAWLIPMLQRQVNALKKERVKQVRKLSERIGETVEGAREIRLQGTQAYTLAEFSERLGNLFWVRLKLFKKKFFMKFLNNTINQITPFMFYLFGGYLVIKGNLSIGALVAAIAAYKDLTSPWRELLNHYQAHADAIVRYGQIVKQFSPEGVTDNDEPSQTSARTPTVLPRLNAPLHVRNVSWQNDSGERTLSNISFEAQPGETIAITGDFAMRRSALADLLTGLTVPDSGRISIGETPLCDIPLDTLRARLAAIGPAPFMFNGTIADNFNYGLNHQPAAQVNIDRLIHTEALASGNSTQPYSSNWVDPTRAGLNSNEEIIEWSMKVADTIGTTNIMYERGLLEYLCPQDKPELAKGLLKVRESLRQQFFFEKLDDVVFQFDPDLYNPNTTVTENILFGVARDERLGSEKLAAVLCDLPILDDLNIREKCVARGHRIAQWLIEFAETAPAGHPTLDHFGIDDDDDLARLKKLAAIKPEKLTRADKGTKCALLSVFLNIVPSEHGQHWIGFRLMTQLVQCRREFNSSLPEFLKDAIEPYDADQYHSRLTIIDNLLFGRMRDDNPTSARRIMELVRQALVDSDLVRPVMLLMTESQVGIQGSRLPTAAKQRIPLGRNLMKRPDILIFHDALSAFELNSKQTTRERIRELLPDCIIIWIDSNVSASTDFDRIYEFTQAGPLMIAGETVTRLRSPSTSKNVLSRGVDNAMDIINHSTLLREIDSQDKQYLAEHSRLVSINARDTLHHAGDNADAVYIIVDGYASSWKGEGADREQMGELGPMDAVGAIEVLAQRTRIFEVEALTDLDLLRIDGNALFDLIDKNGRTASRLLRALTEQWATPVRQEDAA